MRNLPTGDRTFHGIPFTIIDPAGNDRRAVIGISTLPGYPRTAEVAVGDTAACIYLLHSSSDNIPSNVAGALTFRYTDGTESSQYLMKGRHVTNWWFSNMKNDHAGVAWWGPNLCSTKVGVCWAAIDNPHPDKKIDKLVFHAPLEGGIYTVIGITLADRTHYVEPEKESFGGPDNWAAACAMAALVEGLAGVKNDGLAYDKVTLAPRWTSAGIDSVHVMIHLPASGGYLGYHYKHNPAAKIIDLAVTGSGSTVRNHILLPVSSPGVVKITLNGIPVEYNLSRIEASLYADFETSLPALQNISIQYK
jgi:hypothetical protein